VLCGEIAQERRFLVVSRQTAPQRRARTAHCVGGQRTSRSRDSVASATGPFVIRGLVNFCRVYNFFVRAT